MNRKPDIKRVIPWLWLILGLAWDGWYHFVHGKEMLDSDMAGEMILANILNKENSVTGMTKSWMYSTSVDVLNIQWPLRLGLLVFPHDWHMARVLGTMLTILLVAFAAWFVMRMSGRNDLAPWSAAFVVFPGGGWYFWQAIYGGYYLMYILISLFSYSLILFVYKSPDTKKRYLAMLLVTVLGILAGMAGVKQLMVFYAPLVLAAIVIYIVKLPEEGIKNNRRIFLVASLWGSVASVVGYGINSKVLSNIYEFRDYGDTIIQYNDSFLDYIRYFTWSFGFIDQKEFLSPVGIASMCGLIFGILLLASAGLLLLRFDKLDDREQILAVVAMTSILFNCLIFTYVKGGMQYFLPVIPFGYLMFVLALDTLRFASKKASFLVLNMAMIMLTVASMGTVYNESHGPIHQYRAKPGLMRVVDMLSDAGYTEGISKFWTANVVTELSDGEIEMFILGKENEQWEGWLEKADHLGSYPEKPYFYIYEIPEKDGFEDHKAELDEAFRGEHPELNLIYEDARYVIYATEM